MCRVATDEFGRIAGEHQAQLGAATAQRHVRLTLHECVEFLARFFQLLRRHRVGTAKHQGVTLQLQGIQLFEQGVIALVPLPVRRVERGGGIGKPRDAGAIGSRMLFAKHENGLERIKIVFGQRQLLALQRLAAQLGRWKADPARLRVQDAGVRRFMFLQRDEHLQWPANVFLGEQSADRRAHVRLAVRLRDEAVLAVVVHRGGCSGNETGKVDHQAVPAGREVRHVVLHVDADHGIRMHGFARGRQGASQQQAAAFCGRFGSRDRLLGICTGRRLVLRCGFDGEGRDQDDQCT